MTIQLPEDLESSIRAAVDGGLYASVDDAVAEAVRLLLRQRADAVQKPPGIQELERRMLESGFLGSVPPPRDPSSPAWSFELVEIEGETISETVIRDRR